MLGYGMEAWKSRYWHDKYLSRSNISLEMWCKWLKLITTEQTTDVCTKSLNLYLNIWILAQLLSHKDKILLSFWKQWQTETCGALYVYHTMCIIYFICFFFFIHAYSSTQFYILVNASHMCHEMLQPRAERPLNKLSERSYCNIRWLTWPWKISPVNNVMLLSHMPFAQTI